MYNNNTYIYIFHAPIFLIRLAPHSVMWKRLCCLQQIPIIFLLISAKLQRKMPWMHFCCCWVQTFNFKKILIASQHLWWFAWFKESNLFSNILTSIYNAVLCCLMICLIWHLWDYRYHSKYTLFWAERILLSEPKNLHIHCIYLYGYREICWPFICSPFFLG